MTINQEKLAAAFAAAKEPLSHVLEGLACKDSQPSWIRALTQFATLGPEVFTQVLRDSVKVMSCDFGDISVSEIFVCLKHLEKSSGLNVTINSSADFAEAFGKADDTLLKGRRVTIVEGNLISLFGVTDDISLPELLNPDFLKKFGYALLETTDALEIALMIKRDHNYPPLHVGSSLITPTDTSSGDCAGFLWKICFFSKGMNIQRYGVSLHEKISPTSTWAFLKLEEEE